MTRKVKKVRPVNICFWLLRIVIVAGIFCQTAKANPVYGFSPEKVAFSVKFKEEESSYKVMGIYVLPGEIVPLKVVSPAAQVEYTADSAGGKLVKKSINQWQWQAPSEAGLYTVAITESISGEVMTLNVFVMVPFRQLKGEYLKGYRIGTYPLQPWKGLSIYKPPRGFIEVTRENEETMISPHFRLRQFVSKQASGYPRYVVLKERLLFKLELILEKANEKGYGVSSLHIMSGYRTPFYNQAIGNVKYSRHVWGGAADIFIDENPRDDMMDDLNRDGRIDYRDAAVLYDIIDGMYGESWYRHLIGGLGWYRKTSAHGPFVHVDVRGFRARWGD